MLGPTSRRLLPLRIAGGVFAFVFWLPSLALTDLVLGLLPADSPATSAATGNLGYGVIGAVLVAPAFASQVRRPGEAAAPIQQLTLVALVLAAAAVASGEYLGLAGAAVVGVPLLVVLALCPARLRALRPPPRPSPLLLGLAAAAALPALAYAWDAASSGRRGAPPEDSYAYIPSVWSAVTAMSLAVVLLAFLAAFRAPGWRLTAWCVGVAALLFGIASVVNPDVPASGGRAWGAAAVLWTVAWATAARRAKLP